VDECVKLSVVYRSTTSLIPYAKNARRHSTRQIELIASSIQEFGFANPVLVDNGNTVLAGHARLEAAKRLGLPEVPTIRLAELTDAQKRAYRLADNQLATLSDWDEEILSDELRILDSGLNFDIEVIGFDTCDLDRMLGTETSQEPVDEIVELPEIDGPVVSQAGDVWHIGPHRILCGDALASGSYGALLGGQKADLVIADPPYNLKIRGHVSGLGAVVHRKFAMASGEMSQIEFTEFLGRGMKHAVDVSRSGALHYMFMDWRHIRELLNAAEGNYQELKMLCIWVKNNGGRAHFIEARHELVFVHKVCKGRHVNNFGVGEKRYRTNIWEYAGVNTFRKGRLDDLYAHPTCKPLALLSDIILDASNRNGLVLDPFWGRVQPCWRPPRLGGAVMASKSTAFTWISASSGCRITSAKRPGSLAIIALRRWPASAASS
jgi:DNA modification methylase